MATNYIPKIQYGNTTLTGNTTIGLPTVTALSTTANLRVGMKAVGAGIPSTATILTIDSTTQVTLTANASATATGVSIEFYDEFTFVYPPTQDSREALKAKAKIDESVSGVRQVAIQHTEATRSLVFRFLTEAETTSLKNFFDNHGKLGKNFKWFTHATESGFDTYELAALDFDPKRILPKDGVFIYELDFKFRRAY